MATKPSKVTKSSGSTAKTTTSSSGTHATAAKKATTTPKKATTKKTVTTSKKASTPAKFSAATLASRWIAGPGDEWPLCSVIAVANSLLAALGPEASNAELERLYRAAAGHRGSGSPVPAVLAAVKETGLAGCRLASWRPVSHPAPGGVLLLELDVTPDLHAAAYLGSGTVATWGDTVPLTDLYARIAGAWDLTWHGGGA